MSAPQETYIKLTDPASKIGVVYCLALLEDNDLSLVVTNKPTMEMDYPGNISELMQKFERAEYLVTEVLNEQLSVLTGEGVRVGLPRDNGTVPIDVQYADVEELFEILKIALTRTKEELKKPPQKSNTCLETHDKMRNALIDMIKYFGAEVMVNEGNADVPDIGRMPAVRLSFTTDTFFDDATLQRMRDFEKALANASNDTVNLEIMTNLPHQMMFVFIGEKGDSHQKMYDYAASFIQSTVNQLVGRTPMGELLRQQFPEGTLKDTDLRTTHNKSRYERLNDLDNFRN